jgi:two-component system OmpR family response regulator
MTKKSIVFVEDDDVIRENYAELLIDEGFCVQTCRNTQQAMACFERALPDIAILDIALDVEREGGFQLCLYLRQRSDILPILFFTSHGSEVDKISGFRVGADDYLTKDISFDYLLVRIDALFRRHDTLLRYQHQPQMLDTSRHMIQIDVERLQIFWQQRAVDLTLTQFWIVQELLAEPLEVKSYQQLMHAAKLYVEPNTIAAHIKTIRQRFRKIDPNFDAIRTERGIGYRWSLLL